MITARADGGRGTELDLFARRGGLNLGCGDEDLGGEEDDAGDEEAGDVQREYSIEPHKGRSTYTFSAETCQPARERDGARGPWRVSRVRRRARKRMFRQARGRELEGRQEIYRNSVNTKGGEHEKPTLRRSLGRIPRELSARTEPRRRCVLRRALSHDRGGTRRHTAPRHPKRCEAQCQARNELPTTRELRETQAKHTARNIRIVTMRDYPVASG